MRKLILAAAMSLATFPAIAMDFCQLALPPNNVRQEPNVAYSIKEAGDPGSKCHSGAALSCAGRCKTGHWVIWIDRDFTALEKKCAILHEKAHLPPNNWKANHRGRRDQPLPMGSWQPDCA